MPACLLPKSQSLSQNAHSAKHQAWSVDQQNAFVHNSHGQSQNGSAKIYSSSLWGILKTFRSINTFQRAAGCRFPNKNGPKIFHSVRASAAESPSFTFQALLFRSPVKLRFFVILEHHQWEKNLAATCCNHTQSWQSWISMNLQGLIFNCE